MLGYFGKRWYLWLVAIVSGIFWPLLLFKSDIKFDSKAFAVEWVKCGVAGFLIVLTVEILNHRRQSSGALLQTRKLLEIRALSPTQRFQDCIRDYLTADQAKNLSKAQGKLQQLRLRWELLGESFDYLSRKESLNAELSLDLRLIASGLEQERNSAFLRELGNDLTEAQTKKLRELLRAISNVEHQLKTVLQALDAGSEYLA